VWPVINSPGVDIKVVLAEHCAQEIMRKYRSLIFFLFIYFPKFTIDVSNQPCKCALRMLFAFSKCCYAGCSISNRSTMESLQYGSGGGGSDITSREGSIAIELTFTWSIQ